MIAKVQKVLVVKFDNEEAEDEVAATEWTSAIVEAGFNHGFCHKKNFIC